MDNGVANSISHGIKRRLSSDGLTNSLTKANSNDNNSIDDLQCTQELQHSDNNNDDNDNEHDTVDHHLPMARTSSLAVLGSLLSSEDHDDHHNHQSVETSGTIVDSTVSSSSSGMLGRLLRRAVSAIGVASSLAKKVTSAVAITATSDDTKRDSTCTSDSNSNGSNAMILLGPVVGRVTSSCARILLELDRDHLLTILVYTLPSIISQHTTDSSRRDDDSSNMVLAQTLRVHFDGHRARAIIINNLLPNTRYCVRFTGVDHALLVSDTDKERMARFRTDRLPTNSNANNTANGTIHTVRMTASSSSSSTATNGSTTDNSEEWRVVALACDDFEYEHRGDASIWDLWTRLEHEYVIPQLVDLIIHHGDQVYADQAFAAGLLIAAETHTSIADQNRRIFNEFQQVYRITWNNPPTRRVLACVQHIMLWDDHGVRNDWGSLPQDKDPTSLDYRVGRMAQLAYWMYQRQLWDDVYPPASSSSSSSTTLAHDDPVNIRASTPVECSFHRFGNPTATPAHTKQSQPVDLYVSVSIGSSGQFGVSFLDSRGCRSFGVTHDDERPFISSAQWNAFQRAFHEADDHHNDDTQQSCNIYDASYNSMVTSVPTCSFFAPCRLLLAVSSITSVFLGTHESSFVLNKFDCLRDKLSLGLHPREQVDYLLTLFAWKQRGTSLSSSSSPHASSSSLSSSSVAHNTREVLLIGGDLHFAVHTDIRLPPVVDANTITRSSSHISRSPRLDRTPKRHRADDGKGSAVASTPATLSSSSSSSSSSLLMTSASSSSSSDESFLSGELMFQQLIVTAISNDPVGLRSFEAWRANCSSSHQNVITDGIKDRRILFKHNDMINNPNFGYIRMHAPPSMMMLSMAAAAVQPPPAARSSSSAAAAAATSSVALSPSLSSPSTPLSHSSSSFSSSSSLRHVTPLLTPRRIISGTAPRSPVWIPTPHKPSETTDTSSHIYISAPAIHDNMDHIDTLSLDAPLPTSSSSASLSLSSSSPSLDMPHRSNSARSLAIAGPGSLTLHNTPTIEARVISPSLQWWDHHQKRARPSRD